MCPQLGWTMQVVASRNQEGLEGCWLLVPLQVHVRSYCLIPPYRGRGGHFSQEINCMYMYTCRYVYMSIVVLHRQECHKTLLRYYVHCISEYRVTYPGGSPKGRNFAGLHLLLRRSLSLFNYLCTWFLPSHSLSTRFAGF